MLNETFTPTPAEYPKTGYPESESILCVQNLINRSRIKAHISENDKTPNHDGFFELLDENRKPIGKVTIQVKTLAAGEVKFSCPSELPAYSRTLSEPFLLLCADATNHRAFWKHIEWAMPEFKQAQKTFTIHFADADSIDAEGNYLERWISICDDYRKRVDGYLLLKQEADNVGVTDGITQEQIQDFQCMIDTINLQFESKWSVLKNRYFPSIWKIGAGIIDITTGGVQYQLYQIPYGKSELLVRKVSSSDFGFEAMVQNINILNLAWHSQSSWEGRKAGLEFIKGYVNKALKTYKFKVRGNVLATEIVTSFVRHYAVFLELQAQEEYDFQDLRARILARFFNSTWLSQHSSQIRQIGLGDIYCNCIVKNGSIPITHHPMMPWPDNGLSKFPLDTLYDALEYLNAQGTETLKNLLPMPDINCDCDDPMQSFSDSRELDRANYISSNIVQAYIDFLKGNELTFLSSICQDSQFSFVHYYAPSRKTEADSGYVPSIIEYYVLNQALRLPKVKFITDTDLSKFSIGNNIEIEGNLYRICGLDITIGANLYSSMPLFSRIYTLLAGDIRKYFNQEMKS